MGRASYQLSTIVIKAILARMLGDDEGGRDTTASKARISHSGTPRAGGGAPAAVDTRSGHKSASMTTALTLAVTMDRCLQRFLPSNVHHD